MTKSDRLHSLLRDFTTKGPAGCALSVTRQGETVFEDYTGAADIETNRAISPDTIYRIYSMTKIVTCTAALMLYERGHFLLNDPLEAYLPEFKHPQVYRHNEKGEVYISPASTSVRIKDLFTMTSGLTYPGDSDETERHVNKVIDDLEKQGISYTARAASRLLADIPLAFDPGSQWRYGLSHDVLGALIEVVSGRPFGQFLQEEIFEPLGMNDTFFRLPDEKKHRLCSLYNQNEQGELAKNNGLDKRYQPGETFESGGGGLLSTLGDFSRFTQMLAANGKWHDVRILGRKTIDLMASNHLDDKQLPYYNWEAQTGYGYGLGVRVMIDPVAGGINSSLGEFGWSGLAGTWALMDRKENLSAVYMQQLLPSREAQQQPRLRNVIYGTLE